MRFSILFLITAAMWGGEPSSPRLLSFTLNETPARLVKSFGQGPNVVSQPAFRTLQFHDNADHTASHSCDGSYEWEFYFTSSGEMQSATWNGSAPMPVKTLFPEKEKRVYSSELGGVNVTVLFRSLPDGRVLIANVQDPQQKEISQAVLMRSNAVSRFLPWLGKKIADE